MPNELVGASLLLGNSIPDWKTTRKVCELFSLLGLTMLLQCNLGENTNASHVPWFWWKTMHVQWGILLSLHETQTSLRTNKHRWNEWVHQNLYALTWFPGKHGLLMNWHQAQFVLQFLFQNIVKLVFQYDLGVITEWNDMPQFRCQFVTTAYP